MILVQVSIVLSLLRDELLRNEHLRDEEDLRQYKKNRRTKMKVAFTISRMTTKVLALAKESADRLALEERKQTEKERKVQGP